MATAESKEIIIMGDVSVSYFIKKDRKDVKEVFALMGMNQLIKNATRTCDTARTLTDIIASNNCKNVRITSVFPSGFSDHDLVDCACKTNHIKFKLKEIRYLDYSRSNLTN